MIDIISQDEETLIQQKKEFQVMLDEQEKVGENLKIQSLYVYLISSCSAGVRV